MPTFDFSNSKEVAWKDLQAFVGGSRCTKIRGLRITSTIELEHLFGEGNKAISIQEGNEVDSFELKMLYGDYVIMDAAARAAGYADLRGLEFDIVAMFKPTTGRLLRTVTLVGCKISDITEGLNQNDKMVEITMPGLALRVVRA